MNKALVNSSYYFIKNYFTKYPDDVANFLKIVINCDIDINFDSATFYLFGKESKINLPIDDKAPVDLLKSILEVIKNNSMGDTIRNSQNRIHFRTYKHKYLLDSENDDIRKALIRSMCLCSPKEFIQNELVKHLIVIINTIRQPDTAESDMCKLTVQKVRVERLINDL